jgi:hypothetical protein
MFEVKEDWVDLKREMIIATIEQVSNVVWKEPVDKVLMTEKADLVS